jgi:hypothetical protein
MNVAELSAGKKRMSDGRVVMQLQPAGTQQALPHFQRCGCKSGAIPVNRRLPIGEEGFHAVRVSGPAFLALRVVYRTRGPGYSQLR